MAVHQVRANGGGARSSNSTREEPVTRALELDELTILTGWAQALVEAVACAPESIATVLANARTGAPWRKDLGIGEPSQSLSEAMRFISRAAQALCSSGDAPTLDEFHVWCRHDRLGEHGLEKLVRRVLRSTLEPLRARQAMRPNGSDNSSRATMAPCGVPCEAANWNDHCLEEVSRNDHAAE